MSIIKTLILCLGIIPIMNGCSLVCIGSGGKKIRGNGTIVTKTFSLEEFKSVSTSGNFDLVLIQDDKSEVLITTDENIIEYLKVEATGQELNIGSKKGYNLSPSKSKRIVAKVHSKIYKDVHLNGSGDITSENILTSSEDINFYVSGSGDVNAEVESQSSKFKISGSGDLVLKGKTKDLDLKVSGSGDVDCSKFISTNADVEISGSGDIVLFMRDEGNLNARISGSGDVEYYGNPHSNIKVSGSGSIKRKEATAL